MTRSSRRFLQDRLPPKIPRGQSRCKAITAKGRQCRGWTRIGGFCHIHDPQGIFQNSGRSNRKGRVNYRDYLRSEHWIEFRRKALTFHGNHCLICRTSASEATLEVHHRNYDCIWHESMDDVMVLCKKCHQAHHERKSI